MATRVQNVQNGPKIDYFWLSPLCMNTVEAQAHLNGKWGGLNMFSFADCTDLELSGTVKAFEWWEEPPGNVAVIKGVCGGKSGNGRSGCRSSRKWSWQRSKIAACDWLYLPKAAILMTSSAMTNALSFKKSVPRSATSRTLIMVRLITTMQSTMMRAPLVQRHNHHHQSPRHAPPRARVVARRRGEPQKVTRPLLQSDPLLGGLQHLLSHRRSAQEVRRNQRNRAARARGAQRSHQRGAKSRPPERRAAAHRPIGRYLEVASASRSK